MTIQDPDDAFVDPLENYESPAFDDPIEQALHDEPVTEIRSQPYQCVDAATTVRDAMKLMTGRQISCVLVTENGKLAGVFGDRDVLDRVALEYDSVIDQPVSTVMSRDPVYVDRNDKAAKALAVMAVSGYRHVPIVDGKREPVGIVSPQRFSKFLESRL